MRVVVINGPNLNLLGTRRPDVYGTTTLAELEHMCHTWGEELGMRIQTFQSNHEGAVLDRLHECPGNADGVVINAGALTHYSYSLHDAIEAIPVPVVEVHISDITAREEWRRVSVISAACAGTINGLGVDGYREALRLLADLR